MLKFFRRIRRKLLNEGGFKKYLVYAIGEILLVMIGILLAIQVNNWNEDQKARKEEYLTLESLHSEFLDTRNLFNRNLRHKERIYYAMQYLLDVLETKQVNKNLTDSIYIHLNASAFSSSTFSPSQGILNSLISSGKLHIISNEKLKLYLIQWSDRVVDYQKVETLSQDYRFTYLYPLITRMTKLPSKRKHSVPGGAYDWNNIIGDEVDLTLFQSKEFYNHLNQCWVFSRPILVEDTPISQGRKIQEAIDNIILLIEKELEE